MIYGLPLEAIDSFSALPDKWMVWDWFCWPEKPGIAYP